MAVMQSLSSTPESQQCVCRTCRRALVHQRDERILSEVVVYRIITTIDCSVLERMMATRKAIVEMYCHDLLRG